MSNQILYDTSISDKNELSVQPILETFFKTKLNLTDKFDIVDYIGDKIQIELKCRNNKKDTYPTTMIGQKKINHLLQTSDTGYVVFKFTDGLYYYQITHDNMKFCKQCHQGGRNDRKKNEYKKNAYCYIPVNLLEKIEFKLDFL